MQPTAANHRPGTSSRPWLVACLLAIVLAGPSHSRAQTAPPERTPAPAASTRLQGGIGIVGAGSVGEFASHVESAGGFLGHLDTALGRSAFSLGGELAYLVYGDQSRTVPLGALIPEVPNATLTVNTEHAMLLVHARLRAQRRQGRWRPYADGLLGFASLFTTSSIPGVQECFGTPAEPVCVPSDVASATNARDVVSSVGAGAGVMIGFGSSPRTPRLDLSMRYLRGGEGRYLTEGDIERLDGRAIFHVRQSRTDMAALYIGVAFGR